VAERGITRMPVVAREQPRKVLGLLTLVHVLEGRRRDLMEERVVERVLDARRILRSAGGWLRIRT
jgi:CIC family chloride channel protein